MKTTSVRGKKRSIFAMPGSKFFPSTSYIMGLGVSGNYFFWYVGLLLSWGGGVEFYCYKITRGVRMRRREGLVLMAWWFIIAAWGGFDPRS